MSDKMTQPTALFLADVIDSDAASAAHHGAAAYELRRLHEDNERMTRERDALLEALKRMASIIDKMGDMSFGFIHPSPWQTLGCEEALEQALAAIKAVEEGK